MSAKIKSAITLGLLLHLGMIRANAYTTTDANADGEGSIGGHEYVDLGLPSGNLWAKCNMGAKLKSVESDGRNGLELTMPGGAYVCSLYKDGRLMHTSKIILR